MTCNGHSFKDDKRLIELENSLKDISWNIIGLAEERNQGEQSEERKHSTFFHFEEISGLHGV